ncbi:hypothetical protein Q4Q34_17610 [Flavivirga abyssicola]|uniref:hypothetical protein n=1 Tax=Flavivirga abyssicola TaxID=3063533 RepID=UPI0026E00B7D|nr:hypothetical protein [Flavivirga sp. MEBiC07777]WVK13034.1 hypothetical protein Q4Q34_17610 [Flavivirga sp. MEBiC07777]
MKRLVLLFAGLLIGLTTVSATELNHQKTENNFDITKRYRYAQPIMFVERGIEFLIFPDGSFDFNTDTYNDYYNNSYYRGNSRRSSVNVTYGTRKKKYRYNPYRYNRGVSISHGRDGKVRRIGDVYINYDRYGKIKRAGSIYMNYNYRHGKLKQVGGLSVRYNHWGGIINTRGQVKGYSDYCNFCGVQSCSVEHTFGNRDRHHDDHDDDDWDDDIYDNDDNYYYFKQNGKVKKHRRNNS